VSHHWFFDDFITLCIQGQKSTEIYVTQKVFVRQNVEGRRRLFEGEEDDDYEAGR
jgi:hypothetical protein